MLVSDLDGTLIPSSPDPDSARAIATLGRLRNTRPDLLLAYATGRHLDLALDGVRSHSLPMPDWLICDVGTSVYRRAGRIEDAVFEPDTGYAARLERACGVGVIRKVRERFDGLSGVRPQDASRQGRFKVSFDVDAALTETAVVEAARDRLGSHSEDFDFIFSIDPVGGSGLLDVIPAGVSKASATRYLVERAGVDTGEVIYAGDSGNDRAALTAEFRSVLVGNAPDAFREQVRRDAGERGIEDRAYFARSAYAAGVVEGCRHFGLL
jgi:HAD superfamily hydrolase (TIGR01484 family)